ncbi:MAG: CrcB family protein [Pirellulales bacterium]|nr:CrcB family protein [Pirellulales bacterium]
MWFKLLYIALAGAAGTLCRYGLGKFAQNLFGESFPWGTVSVNLLGCLAFGLVWTSLEDRWPTSGETRFIILVGFMGAFTTFSTYMFEIAEQLRSAQWLAASGYFALHNLGGWAAMILGLFLGKWI